MDYEFKGYWSERDKELWLQTDWKARDYKELPVEDDKINHFGYFYNINGEIIKQPLIFVKYIRPNPIFPPYYGPEYTAELLEFMHNGDYCYPCFDGNMEGNYSIHDRFDDSEVADRLSR